MGHDMTLRAIDPNAHTLVSGYGLKSTRPSPSHFALYPPCPSYLAMPRPGYDNSVLQVNKFIPPAALILYLCRSSAVSPALEVGLHLCFRMCPPLVTLTLVPHPSLLFSPFIPCSEVSCYLHNSPFYLSGL